MTATPKQKSKGSGGVYAVFRHEMRLFLHSPLTVIFQVGFLGTLAAGVFLIADYYAGDEASVRPMLVFLPWVALILVPALAMRAWADEQGDRGGELMMTLPVSLPAVVMGKFLAGTTVLLTTLAFTTPIAATAAYLGDPDPGVTVAVYVAAALMLGTYYALSLLASAFAREPIGAFVVGLVALFVLLLLGWDVFGRLLHGWVPPAVIGALAAYSPKTWLDSLSRGLLDVAGVGYFVLVTAAALGGCVAIIGARRRGPLTAARAVRGGAIGFVAVVGLALFIPQLSRVPLAIDLTAEREFTLADGSLVLLERLPEGTEATLYWSAGEPSVPASIKTHARRARDLFQTLAARSGGRLTFRAVDPQPDTDAELTALGSGIRRVPMSSGDNFYLGATVTQGGRVGSVAYFDIRRAGLLEYDIAVALNGLTKARTPKVGLLSPLIPSAAAAGKRQGFSFLEELKRSYDIAVIPFFKGTLPDDLDVLIVIDATILKSEMLYAIDQFVMKGGSLIVMIDPFLRFNRESNRINPEPGPVINDISDLLLAYGVRYEGDSVVGDQALAAPVSDGSRFRMSYPYWMRMGAASLSADHPASAALNEVFFVEPGEMTRLDNDRAQALLTTTNASGTRARGDFNGLSPRQLALDFKSDARARDVVVALRGPFESAFPEPPKGADGPTHQGRSAGNPTVFAVADVDWLFDPFSLQSVDVGGRTVVRPLNDNLAFLLNMVEFAAGDPALIDIRSRGRLQRPFTRVAQLFRQAEDRYREQESKLAAQVAKAETRIAELLGTDNPEALERVPPELSGDVAQVRADLFQARKKLRDIRRRIRERVERLGARVAVINLAAGPALSLLLAGGLLVFRRRRRNHRTAA